MKFLFDGIFAIPLKSNWYLPFMKIGFADSSWIKYFFLLLFIWSYRFILERYFLDKDGSIKYTFMSLVLFDPKIDDL